MNTRNFVSLGLLAGFLMATPANLVFAQDKEAPKTDETKKADEAKKDAAKAADTAKKDAAKAADTAKKEEPKAEEPKAKPKKRRRRPRPRPKPKPKPEPKPEAKPEAKPEGGDNVKVEEKKPGGTVAPAASGKLAVEADVQKTYQPLGYVGPYSKLRPDPKVDAVPIPNRWLLPFPRWERYAEFRKEESATGWTYDYPYSRGGILDPYQQNILKGDYPIVGDDIFFVMTLISDTILEQRTAPTPRGIASRDDFGEEFFGEPRQNFIAQTVIASFELFKGDTAFRPRDWEVRFTPAFNLNYLELQEFNGVNIDVRDERTRLDYHVGIQELFYEYHVMDVSENYDFFSFRFGIQGFVSDFRGFLYSENQPGVRLSGNYFSNRLAYNVAFFYFLEKDTNSGLNELKDRRQQVFIANVIWQDAFKEFLDEDLGEGFTLLLSYHYNRDAGDQQFDENGFNVRPGRFGRPFGTGPAEEHTVRVHYLGLAGEGHIGRFNLTFEYFFAFGKDTFNPIAGRPVNISAQFFMAEPSVDFDWLRVKGNFLYAQGDPDPESSRATGFDTIVDNPNFAGSEDSFYQRQSVILPQTTTILLQRFSFFNSLRTGKNEGQANFVNPGLILMGGGLDARVSPTIRAEFNINYLLFDRPESTELLVFQREVDRTLGVDYNLGIQYRPLLTDNVIINIGAALFQPLNGFQDLYESKNTLYQGFIELVLVY